MTFAETGYKIRELILHNIIKLIVIVRALTSFHFNVFLKKVLRTVYNQNKSFPTRWFWDNNHL